MSSKRREVATEYLVNNGYIDKADAENFKVIIEPYNPDKNRVEVAFYHGKNDDNTLQKKVEVQCYTG